MSCRIAIIVPNLLVREGLSGLLERYFAPIIVDRFECVEQCAAADGCYDYYFTDALGIGTEYLLARHEQCIVLSDRPTDSESPVPTLYTGATQEQTIERLSELIYKPGEQSTTPSASSEISPREAEVLILVVSGAINKEIAARLNISLNTVLTHRKNITAKLGIKSVSGLTLYALMNGYITPEKISAQSERHAAE